MLPELHEADATGRIADIYAEIRLFSGVPYVSSLQRYLATIPGVLEWAWDVLRPGLASGLIPETGWRLAQSVRLTSPSLVPEATCRAWGVDESGLAAIRNIAANFIRVSPVNLVTGACLAGILNGAPTGQSAPPAAIWAPPGPLPAMLGNVNASALPTGQAAVLHRFATQVDGVPFIPALYRQIAHFPKVLAWLADELVPRLTDAETMTKGAAFRQAARDAAPAIVACLPKPAAQGRPDADSTRKVMAAVDRYAQTSPEMTLFGQFILDALPATLSA
jgi:hypothetical protein